VTIGSYLEALSLTLIVELLVAALMGYKNLKAIIAVICVNLITHPLFNYFLWLNESVGIIDISYFSIILMEIVITVIEALLMYYALKQKFIKMLNLSFWMNCASFVSGILIFNYDF